MKPSPSSSSSVPGSFRSAAIEFLRNRAVRMAEPSNYELVSLAAYVFAIASQLTLNHGNPRLLLRRETEPVLLSKEELLRRLANLSEDLDASSLYWALIDALVSLEALIVRPLSNRTSMRPWTQLVAFPEGSYRGLSGRVLHWIRPVSELAKERDLRFEVAVSPPPDPSPLPSTYLTRLGMYWDSDPQLPAVVPVKPGMTTHRLFESSGGDAAERKCFRVALSPLSGSFHPLFKVDDAGQYFQVLLKDGMKGREELNRHLAAVVEEADRAGVHLLVMPELSVDPPAREHLKALLLKRLAVGESSLYGIVAGSFHVWREPVDNHLPLPVNEAVLLDPAGDVAVRHCKKGRFRVPSRQVRRGSEFFPEKPPKLAREVFEDIRYGTELKVLDTSLGRLAFLICADAIAADDKGYLPVVRHLRPDLLIVVSMSPETQPFDAFAEDMRRHWIGTLFVNAHSVCWSPDPQSWPDRFRRVGVRWWNRLKDRVGIPTSAPNLAACDLALHEIPEAPPTRVRWRYGESEPECIYFKPSDGNRKWRPASRALGPTGVSWLTSGDENIGVVLDLGVHWSPKTDREEKISA